MVLFSLSVGFSSCTPEDIDPTIETPAYATGGDEIDDPAEPDEDR